MPDTFEILTCLTFLTCFTNVDAKRTPAPAPTQTPAPAPAPAHIQTDTHTRIRTHTRTHTQTQTHRHTDTQTHRHTDTQTHRHTDTHTNTHTGKIQFLGNVHGIRGSYAKRIGGSTQHGGGVQGQWPCMHSPVGVHHLNTRRCTTSLRRYMYGLGMIPKISAGRVAADNEGSGVGSKSNRCMNVPVGSGLKGSDLVVPLHAKPQSWTLTRPICHT